MIQQLMTSFRKNKNNQARQVLHDLATPLTNVLWDLEEWAESTKSSGDEESEQDGEGSDDNNNGEKPYTKEHPVITPEALKQALSQLQHASRMLTNFSRDCQASEAQIFDPVESTRQTIKSFRKPYGVKCELAVHADSDLRLYGSPDDFVQILTHLLNNAAESYHPVRVDRPIFVKLECHDEGLVLQVSDRGVGIETGKLKRLNHPPLFHRLYTRLTSDKQFRGGFGLSQVRRLLQHKFSGSLQLISTAGHGTTVIVYIPLE